MLDSSREHLSISWSLAGLSSVVRLGLGQLLALRIIAGWVLTSWVSKASSQSKFEGISEFIVLIFLLSFAASENGLRPMCFNVQRRHRRRCRRSVAAAAPRSVPRKEEPRSASKRLNMHASRFCSACAEQKKSESGKRHVAPRHCHARARCSAPCTRAHARRACSSRTHHECTAPCVRASPAMHMLYTHACTSHA